MSAVSCCKLIILSLNYNSFFISQEELEKGIEEGSFSNNEKGFKEFTIQAEKIIKNPALRNVIRKKEFYYIDGKNKIRDGVIVIKYNDKIQTMMPGDLKSYIKMIQNENIKITNTK